MKTGYEYIYGPVSSWRLGSSLGIDLLSREEKICNFDCLYCQLGPTKRYASERKIYIPVETVLEEMRDLPDIRVDYITFSGRGEPTLAANLGEAIKAIKLIRKVPIAVLTNASLMDKEGARRELALADFIVAKLDAYSPQSLQEINRPAPGIEFGSILEGIKEFKKGYQGKLALQIMFIENNKNNLEKFIYLVNYIKPDEVQINTPLRLCNIKALERQEIFRIKHSFVSLCKGINIVSVYDGRAPKDVLSISDEDTLKRRGKVK